MDDPALGRPPKARAFVTFIAGLFVLTGGLGALVPRIYGLNATEYWCLHALWGVLASLLLATLAVAFRRHPIALAVVLVFPTSVAANMALGQDPLAASMNWRVHAADLCTQPCTCWPECVLAVENHVIVERWPTPDGDFYLAAGPGLDVPPAIVLVVRSTQR